MAAGKDGTRQASQGFEPPALPCPAPALQSYFRPELLNRLDEVVVFRPLGEREVRVIAELELAKTAARMSERGIGLEVGNGSICILGGLAWQAQARE